MGISFLKQFHGKVYATSPGGVICRNVDISAVLAQISMATTNVVVIFVDTVS